MAHGHQCSPSSEAVPVVPSTGWPRACTPHAHATCTDQPSLLAQSRRPACLFARATAQSRPTSLSRSVPRLWPSMPRLDSPQDCARDALTEPTWPCPRFYRAGYKNRSLPPAIPFAHSKFTSTEPPPSNLSCPLLPLDPRKSPTRPIARASTVRTPQTRARLGRACFLLFSLSCHLNLSVSAMSC